MVALHGAIWPIIKLDLYELYEPSIHFGNLIKVLRLMDKGMLVDGEILSLVTYYNIISGKFGEAQSTMRQWAFDHRGGMADHPMHLYAFGSLIDMMKLISLF